MGKLDEKVHVFERWYASHAHLTPTHGTAFLEGYDAALAASEASQRALREALFDEWESNHWEHCSDWPHPDKTWCGWPLLDLLATAAPPAADDAAAKPLPTTAEMTRSDRGVTGWVEES